MFAFMILGGGGGVSVPTAKNHKKSSLCSVLLGGQFGPQKVKWGAVVTVKTSCKSTLCLQRWPQPVVQSLKTQVNIQCSCHGK